MLKNDEKILLRSLCHSDQESFDEAVNAFEGSNFQFAFGYKKGDNFRDYVNCLRKYSLGHDLPEGWLASLFLVGVVNNKIIGRLSLRLDVTQEMLKTGGHIGYAVCPKFRNLGYAKEMLSQGLLIAKSHGLKKVLLTCNIDNEESRRTILANGGVKENQVWDAKQGTIKERYWIVLTDDPP